MPAIRTSQEFISALTARRHVLGMSQQMLDEIAGLPVGQL
jgi:hypothetical protein